MLIKDQAICIRAVDFSETSQVVTFFTKATGKITTIAKGSKRPKSAFDGPIEVFSIGNIVFSDSQEDKLATLTEFQQKPGMLHLPHNLFALNCSLFASELLERLTNDYDPHPDLFNQFLDFLQNLDTGVQLHDKQSGSSARSNLMWLILFQLVLLREIGLRPILNSCANCKSAFSPAWREIYFSSAANSLICRDCQESYPDKIRLSPDAATRLANLKLIANSPESTLKELEKVLIQHFTYILHKPPKMAKWII
jgi:DNA repair protein RecO (recombination protein O)